MPCSDAFLPHLRHRQRLRRCLQSLGFEWGLGKLRFDKDSGGLRFGSPDQSEAQKRKTLGMSRVRQGSCG